VFLAGYVFTASQKYFLPEAIRPFTYVLFISVLLLSFFAFLKPTAPSELSNSVCAIFFALASLAVASETVFFAVPLSYKAIIILLGAFFCPYLCGHIYSFLQKKAKA